MYSLHVLEGESRTAFGGDFLDEDSCDGTVAWYRRALPSPGEPLIDVESRTISAVVAGTHPLL
jgi:hypothetical protein